MVRAPTVVGTLSSRTEHHCMNTANQACGEELCCVFADSPFVAMDDYMRNKNHYFIIKSPGDSE